ncbi:RNA polymerase sigma factor [Nocardioides lianchengensis]|uniref:RNA polymerase sigma factor, sigma-70 family n=1 Tax=Nocardioides lianchengensis TaxID=1045774 RepID=A0A1G6LI16_9ACTN|nr:sigma-70 family RNA polymerase sigma factor [Nocardioides lianchengensis]NYG12555.1 RNA polymerase sigma factor (sigma-70 family) [Nocardioides lianchengensis]SDC42607.1 RNA polymerase sigma factor, sigma-70 family [Nocardioides lianchengensis]
MAARRPAARVVTGASAPPDGLWADASRAFVRWLDGDPSGLDELVAVMTPVLWHVVRAYRLPQEAAEDVVQSTWLALVRRRTAIADPAAVGGWLTTTARRESWRVAKAGQHVAPAADEELAARLPAESSAETSAVEADSRHRIWSAVDALPERCQRLLRVVAFERRPDYQSLASDLDMPIGSIGPTRGRCLAKLRVALVQAGEI